MDQNDQPTPRSMVADDCLNPVSTPSRAVLDEPAAPRRNSSDDLDATRPRKRPAVMASQDGHSQSLPNNMHAHGDDRSFDEPAEHLTDDPSLPLPHHPRKPEASKTIELRAPLTPEAVLSNESGKDPGLSQGRDESNSPSYSPDSHTEPPVDSDSQSIPRSSPEIEVEEVEMDVADDYSGQIHIQSSTNEAAASGSRARKIMEVMGHGLETRESPLEELQQFSDFLSTAFEQLNPADFEIQYLENLEFWCLVPNVLECFMRRTESFAPVFYNTTKGDSGVDLIVKVLSDFVQVATRFIERDRKHLQAASTDQEINIYCRQYIRGVHMISQPTRLYQILEFDGTPIVPRMSAVVERFLEPRGFLNEVRQFLPVAFRQIPLQPKLLYVAAASVTAVTSFLRIIVGSTNIPIACNEETIRVAGEMLVGAEADLARVLESHIQSIDIKDFVYCTECLSLLAQEVYACRELPSTLISQFIEKTYGYGQPELMGTQESKMLAEYATRFPFYYKMMASSRMDFRIRGLVKMGEYLIKAWKAWQAYRRSGIWEELPVLRYLVRFLLRNRVIDYLVGPDSHLELIRRCSNIPSFLIVSCTITEDVLDTLWQPIIDNKDPRIVHATLLMHREMITNMGPDLLVQLCTRITALPHYVLGPTSLELVAPLLDAIKKYAFHREASTLGPEPYEMLARLIRMPSEHEADNSAAADSFCATAAQELKNLSAYGPAKDFRRRIYADCVQDFKDKNERVTGSAIVVHAFLQNRTKYSNEIPTAADDISYLIQECHLQELMVEEIATFIGSQRDSDSGLRLRGLRPRLQLLRLILDYRCDCLSDALREKLWLYLVGIKSLGASERDVGFEFYLSFSAKFPGTHAFLDSAYREYFPALDPMCFSPKVLEFCEHSMNYRDHLPPSQLDQPAEGAVPLGRFGQLWRIIFCSRDDSIAHEASNMLVEAVLRGPKRTLLEAVEQVVERCMAQLTSCSCILSSTSTEVKDLSAEGKFLEDSVRQSEAEYRRSIALLNQLAKEDKRLNWTSRSVIELGTRGDEFSLRMVWHAEKFVSPHIKAGSSNTGKELHKYISTIIRGDQFRVFFKGKEIKLLDVPSNTLKDLGFTPDCPPLLVRKTPDDHEPDKMPAREGASDGLENIIMRYFNALYSLLDLPSEFASKAYEFLVNFAPHEQVKGKLYSSPPVAQLFSIEKPYRLLYTLYALDTCLKEYDRSLNSHTVFIQSAVEQVTLALTNSPICMPTESINDRVLVTDGLTKRLRLLLKESVPISFTDKKRYIHSLYEIFSACGKSHANVCDGVDSCVMNAIDVLFESCKIDEDIWDRVSSTPEFRGLIRDFLISDKRSSIRRCVGDAIKSICIPESETMKTRTRDFTKFFWAELRDMVSRDPARLDAERSDALFNTVIEVYEATSVSCSLQELKELFVDWLCCLTHCPSKEVVGRPRENHVITGYARLLTQCIAAAGKQGISGRNAAWSWARQSDIDRLWRHLFPPLETGGHDGLSESIPCLHDYTRLKLYELMLELSQDSDHCSRMIVDALSLFPRDLELRTQYNHERRRWLRAEAGFVGLSNLSNTCYLNSLLTQLFMNTSFRGFILSLPVDSTDQASYHLKGLFARMQGGLIRAVEPRELVETLRDSAGQPIDPNNQMDVDEFYNLLFDRLESEMPSTDLKTAFRSYYGGQLVQQVKSGECGHISERMEPFAAIQCDIKGKASLEDSLKAYVEGEVMDGENKYWCSTCGRLVNAVKRTCVKDVPDNLILHLKRFDFDLQTYNRSKINDSFDFPATLDMCPYTLDYLSTQGDSPARMRDTSSGSHTYELVGILVHTGTAESGHYYSFIRDRMSSSTSWVEYNDAEVSSFDPDTIPSACFGGSDGVNSGGYGIFKPYSAYMLFYERSKQREPMSDACALRRPEIPRIPIQLHKQVVRENEVRLRSYCMADEKFIAFSRKLVENQIVHRKDSNLAAEGWTKTKQRLLPERMRQAIALAVNLFECIAIRIKDCQEVGNLARTIKSCIGGVQDAADHQDESQGLFAEKDKHELPDEDCCYQLLSWAAEEDTITQTLVSCPWLKARQTFTEVLHYTLRQLKAIEGIASPDQNDTRSHHRRLNAVYEICQGFLQAWSGLQWALRPWNDFFNTLLTIGLLGSDEKEIMLRAGVLLKILEMTLAEHLSPTQRRNLDLEGFPKQWGKPKVPTTKLAELLASLLEACSPYLPVCNDEKDRSLSETPGSLPLSYNELHYLTLMEDDSLEVVRKLLDSTPGTVESVARMISHIITAESAPAEHSLLTKLKTTLLNGISVEPAALAWPYLQCLYEFVSVTPSQKYVANIVRKVALEVPTINNSGGPEHLWFFRRVFELGGKAEYSVFCVIDQWAPALLLYCDSVVREDTEEFVKNSLFAAYEASKTDETCKSIQTLAYGILNFLHNKIAGTLWQPDTLDNAIRVLDHIVSLQVDGQLESKFEDVKRSLSRMAEEDDADLASDEDWQCSDIGSDTQAEAIEEYGT